MIDKPLVFIADRVSDHKNATLRSRDLEKLDNHYFNSIMEALGAISSSVIHYSSPVEFIEHIAKHKDCIVLSLWSGEDSRNRRALVPSICEAYGIPYIGGDPYVQTVCADKHLAKVFCRQHGVDIAKDVVISRPSDFPILETLRYPAVVKPNFEGGSIGIMNKNLVDSYEEAKVVCGELLPIFQQLLVEEYVPGEEISVCIAGAGNQIDVFEVIRIVVGGQSYFEHTLYDAEVKKAGASSIKREIITERIPGQLRDKLLALYKSMGKVDVMRIDGRSNSHGFTVIELTPDCNLSATSSMRLAFQHAGYTYTEMLQRLCENALKHPAKTECQNASK